MEHYLKFGFKDFYLALGYKKRLSLIFLETLNKLTNHFIIT